MAVDYIEKYRQLNGNDVLKVILKPTKTFPDGYFYCDASDEELVKKYTWGLLNQNQSYVRAVIGSSYSQQNLYFHQEKANNILNYYPDYINHINGIEFDNVNQNLDVVTNQQNIWCTQSKGYSFTGRSFVPYVGINSHNIYDKYTKTEVEAVQSVYQLELQYEDYRYDFMKDRRHDLDILDMERTGRITEEEAIYRHVLRYAADNAWYYYRYNLAEYFREYRISVPKFSVDIDGFMVHPITGQKLCPL